MTEQNVTIELSLPLAAVNYIMAVLAKQPFEQVADLVMDIRAQTIPQVPAPESANDAEPAAAA